ncbi:hypothetical protein GZH53_18120 [Flavihumibacter sp. R14]|nr:hypothetical protein [Flavihumibacter soli]
MKHPLFFFCILAACFSVRAQTPNEYLPYSFQSYQKIESKTYDPSLKYHTAFKPFFADDSLVASGINSSYKSRLDTLKNTWPNRKLFNEHLVEIKRNDFAFYADFLPDAQVGKSIQEDDNTWLNTLGYQAGGTIGTKFSVHTSGYKSEQKFPLYLNSYAESTKVVSGQNYVRNPLDAVKDWSYFTALVSYTPVKYVNFTLGKDKMFLGDGYRSMLLSDYGINYPFVRVTASLGNVQYTAMWASMQGAKSTETIP